MASPPAWSIGSSKRSTDLRSGVPGPGSYNSSHKNKPNNPSWRLGTAARSAERKSEVPGPGTYNSPGKVSKNGPQYVFGLKTSTEFKDFTPGPGTYSQNGLRGYDSKAPSYSFRVKSANPGDKVKVPGPGTYDQSSKITSQHGPAYKIGSGKRDDIYRSGSTPGPGTYGGTRPSSAVGEGPKYGFGSSGRDSVDAMAKTAPGPGAYNYKGYFEGAGKGTSMVPRRPESALYGAAKSPGPGAYNPSSMKTSPPAYGMGSGTRDSKDRAGTPGPGNYDPRHVSGNQNVKIGTSTRQGLYGNKNTPGPGTYDHNAKVGEGPKYVMNPRRDDNSASSKYIPGPGAYNPSVDLVKNKNSAIGIGTSNRYDLHPTKYNPGPGQYDTRGRLGGPKWGFGSELRGQEAKSNVPGPGQYKLPHTVGDVPKYAYGSSPLKIHL